MPISPDRVRWNLRYSDPSYMTDWAPDVVLAQRVPELPKGRALDVGCGVGANSLFLAKRGYKVDSVDMSDVAIETLRRAAKSEGVFERVDLLLSDVCVAPFEPETYDLVISFRFFSTQLAPRLVAALKPGGSLLCKAFTTNQLRYRPDWPRDRLVEPGELPNLFSELESELYEESDETDDAHALFLGRKP